MAARFAACALALRRLGGNLGMARRMGHKRSCPSLQYRKGTKGTVWTLISPIGLLDSYLEPTNRHPGGRTDLRDRLAEPQHLTSRLCDFPNISDRTRNGSSDASMTGVNPKRATPPEPDF